MKLVQLTASLNNKLKKKKFQVCHHRDPSSIPDQSMWVLWWPKWHWDMFFSKYSIFLCLCHSTCVPWTFIHPSITSAFIFTNDKSIKQHT